MSIRQAILHYVTHIQMIICSINLMWWQLVHVMAGVPILAHTVLGITCISSFAVNNCILLTAEGVLTLWAATLCSNIFRTSKNIYILYRTILSYFRHGNRKVKIYMSCDMPFGFKMHPLSILVHTVCMYCTTPYKEKINLGNECIRLLIRCICLVRMQYYFYQYPNLFQLSILGRFSKMSTFHWPLKEPQYFSLRVFIMNHSPGGPLTETLGPFRNFSKIRVNIRCSRCKISKQKGFKYFVETLLGSRVHLKGTVLRDRFRKC